MPPDTSPNQSDEIASPCVNICVLHTGEGICVGCMRTREEIANWQSYGAQTRARIMQELPSRAPRLKKRRGGRAHRTHRSYPDE